MKKWPIVFIVILNWNQKSDTLNCLQSLQRVSYPHVEVVVVDNGSTDGSRWAIRNAYPAVKLIEQNQNNGCSGGRNIGLRYAIMNEAEYILFLDNDTEVSPDFLNHLVDAAEQDPMIGVVGSKIVYHDEPSIVWIAGGRIDANGVASAFYYDEHVSKVPDIPYDVDWVPGCALMAKRCVFNTIGGFDDSYFIYFEDIDWCVRAAREGYRVIVAPRSIIRHKVGRSLGGHDSPRRLCYMSRNRLLFIQRHVKGPQKWLAIASGILQETRCALDDIKWQRSESAKARCQGIIHFLLGRFGPLLQS